MKLHPLLLLTIFLLLAPFIYAQHGPLAADEIMKEAIQQAAKEKKNVLIIFHASWCGWCHKMDSSINDKNCKKFFDDNYVIRHLVVLESPNKKNMENPGAMEMMTRYGGGDGIPYWLIFDKDGKLLADSQLRPTGAGFDIKGENVGCPAAEKEVAHFISVLKKTSHLTSSDQTAIEKRFRQNE
ncbi:MAG TPA: thioredoxin family protein [Chitinophagaceae bacterium]|jgi:thiol-disulfide isomerase/thioredoxin|nr:thioredoxin family protein [Chitinophagaceae bacterium]